VAGVTTKFRPAGALAKADKGERAKEQNKIDEVSMLVDGIY
jgi:hypothetical protein